MFEMFEEIFAEVMTETGITEWYELFDSEAFEIVESCIAETYGMTTAEEVEGFTEWYNGMAMDL